MTNGFVVPWSIPLVVSILTHDCLSFLHSVNLVSVEKRWGSPQDDPVDLKKICYHFDGDLVYIFVDLGPLLLTWLNTNLSMDK